jgi:hypothetical protein
MGAYYGVEPQECGVTADLSISSGLLPVTRPRNRPQRKIGSGTQGSFNQNT